MRGSLSLTKSRIAPLRLLYEIFAYVGNFFPFFRPFKYIQLLSKSFINLSVIVVAAVIGFLKAYKTGLAALCSSVFTIDYPLLAIDYLLAHGLHNYNA